MNRRWSARPIRLRLAAWYSVAVALTLIVYAAAMFVAVRHEFFEQLDDELADDLDTAVRRVAPAADGTVTWSEDAERAVEAWAPGGQPIHRSTALALLGPPGAGAGGRYRSVLIDGRPWRTLTGSVSVGGRPMVLRVGRNETRLQMQLWEVLVVLILGVPFVIGLSAAGGYLLARRALAPLGQLASDARRITADHLHERLTPAHATDEVGQLAGIINDMLGRLQTSFDALRRFTADASHELRTPLSVIRSIGEMGLGADRTPTEYQEAIGSMLEEVDRLAGLVDTLLRLSRGDAGTVVLARERVDLAQLARDVAATLGILAEERRQHLVMDAHDEALVWADPTVLREAITNVLDNAVTYGPPGSTVTLRVRSNAREAVVSIADEGPGIPVAYRERVFDRFFRLEEARSREGGGTGLGLAIARWAVEVHGGHIAVEDGPRGGSVFRIVLPLGEGSDPAGRSRPSARTGDAQ
jgi:heavy metal sensor kinase